MSPSPSSSPLSIYLSVSTEGYRDAARRGSPTTFTVFLTRRSSLVDVSGGAGGTNEFTSSVPHSARFPTSFLKVRSESTS